MTIASSGRMSSKSNFILMAEYNKWMNASIYSAASNLGSEELAKDRGAFFDSIIGTLNHILVADIIWLKRFATHSKTFTALDSLASKPKPEKLDSLLFSELALLKQERVSLDNTILNFVNQLSEGMLASNLNYQNMRGVSYSKCFAHLLLHFFNHQTHHRGQVSTLLSQLSVDLGVTDLLVKIPNA